MKRFFTIDMSEPHLTYRTLTSTTFERTGELPTGTRRVEILVEHPGEFHFPFGGDYSPAAAEEIIKANYARGGATKALYHVFPSHSNEMSDEDKAKLQALSEARRAEKKAQQAALAEDNRKATEEYEKNRIGLKEANKS